MDLHQCSDWLASTSFSLAIQESRNAIPAIQTVHILALSLLFAAALIFALRVAGRFIAYLSERLLPWTGAAFGGAVLTGGLMFMANAVSYTEKAPFLIKMGLLLLAGPFPLRASQVPSR